MIIVAHMGLTSQALTHLSPCGRRYVHIWRPPKLEFCPECKVKVENDRTDICPECQRKLREYEEKYHCIVDIGVRGLPGPPGDAESKP